jgi:hypothetical protein
MIDIDGKIDMLPGLASRIDRATERMDQRTERIYQRTERIDQRTEAMDFVSGRIVHMWALSNELKSGPETGEVTPRRTSRV